MKKVKNKKRGRKHPLQQLFSRVKNRESLKLFSIIFLSILILIFSSAYIMHYLEQGNTSDNSIKSFIDAFWWSIVTITTVGYGDLVPHSILGKIAGVVVILLGYSLFSLFTGLVSSIFVEERMKGAQGLKPIKNHNHIVFLGWNKTAENMLEVFQKHYEKIPVIVIVDKFNSDFFHNLTSHFHGIDLKYVRGDYFQEETMHRANILQSQQVYVFPSDFISKEIADDRSTIAASTIRYLSSDLPLIVQLMKSTNKKHLEQIGVNHVLIFEEMGGYLLANTAQNHQFSQIYNELLSGTDSSLEVSQIPLQFIGKTFKELSTHFFDKDVLAIGIYSEKPKLSVNDIFSDDSSGIDEFIRTMLDNSNTNISDVGNRVQLKPKNDYVITNLDKVIVLESDK